MMLTFFLFSMGALATAWAVANRTGEEATEEGWGLTWLEGLTLFFLLWIGVSWTLAALRWLRPAGLMGAAMLMSLLTVVIVRRNPEIQRASLSRAWRTLRSLRSEWVFLGAFGLLISFNLFKAWILPCANSDALAWSMPIAIRYLLNHGLDWTSPLQAEWIPHISDPHNYELMVVSILSLTGTDRITEWLSTLTACGILLVIGIQFRRWSGPGLHVWTTLVIFAAAPVFLLNMAADKADLLTTLLILLGIFWSVRAYLDEAPRPGLLALWVLFALFNVKRSGWMLAPPLLIPVFLRWVFQAARGRVHWTQLIVRTLGHSLAAGLAMGGMKTIWVWHQTRPSLLGGTNPIAHHTWLDPLRFLWVLSLAPFRSTDYTVRLLSGVEWFWPEYNLIYSHFGWLFGFTLLAAMGVLAGSIFHKGPARRFPPEQWICLWSSSFLAYFVLSRSYAYDGGFNTFPRILLFVFPTILAAGLLPLLALARRPWVMGTAALILLGGAASRAYEHDMVAPLVYLEDLWKHPEKRRWVLVGPNRMPCIVDRLAGPRAVVVSDCTYQTWLAPLWGEGFTREVRLIEWRQGRPQIPPEAEWVVIDNISGQMWGNGHVVRSAEDFAKAFRHGVPTERDTLLFPFLKADPSWEIITASPLGEQAIFKRRSPKMVSNPSES